MTYQPINSMDLTEFLNPTSPCNEPKGNNNIFPM